MKRTSVPLTERVSRPRLFTLEKYGQGTELPPLKKVKTGCLHSSARQWEKEACVNRAIVTEQVLKNGLGMEFSWHSTFLHTQGFGFHPQYHIKSV